MKHTKIILSIFLALMTLISIIPMSTITASAEDSATSGTCGENLTWTFDDSTGTLTISGTGAMYDFDYNNRLWESYEDSIKTISLADGVITIGEFAFYNCDSLTSVTIPDSVTTIGDGAFRDCNSLENITIPDSVTTIGYASLFCCYNLKNITVDINNHYYSSDEYGVLFNKDKTALIQYPAGNTRTCYTTPDSVTTIGDGAFSTCRSLTSIIISDGVKTIGDAAFTGSNNLTSITIPNSVTSIGIGIFSESERFPDIYYLGTTAQWNNIIVAEYNLPLLYTVNIHYHHNDYIYNLETTSPICTEKGYTTYIYECGCWYKDNYVDATGHNYTWTMIIDATCKKQGVNLGECSECGNLAVEYTDETEHNYESIVTAPTCKDKGYTTYICACGESYIEDYVDATGHDYSWSTIVDASCTEDGVLLGVCKNCESSAVDYTDATGHNLVDGDCVNCDYTENVGNEDNNNENNNDNVTNPSDDCSCNCHKDGISKFFFDFALFFQKLFGANKTCACGTAHY